MDNYTIQRSYTKKEGLLSVFIILLYSYNISLAKYLYGSNANGVFTLLIAAVIIFLMTLVRTGIHLDLNNFFWGSFFILSCFNNQNIKHNNMASWLTLFVAIVMMCCLKYCRNWIQSTMKIFAVFSMMHITATIILFLFPSLYYGFVINLFDSSLYDFLSNLYQNHCMAGITDHYSTNGMYLAVAFMFFVCKIFNKESYQMHKVKYWSLIAFSLFALLLTGKRAHLLFSIFAVLLVYLVNNHRYGITNIIKIIGTILLSGFTLFILSFFVPAILNTFNRFNEIFNGGDITNGRYEFYDLAYSMFLQHPILGNGWGSFMYTYQKLHGAYGGIYTLMSAHNVYLQVLCEVGILGLLIFLVCIFYNLFSTLSTLYHLYRTNSHYYSDFKKYCLSFSACVQTFFILYCLTGNPLYDAQMLIPYIIVCAMSARIKYENKVAIEKMEKG